MADGQPTPVGTNSRHVTLSVVVPTCRRVEDLSRCLTALLGQLGVDDQVIVSEDDPERSAFHSLSKTYPTVIWQLGPCRGPAANRNAGAKLATNDAIIFLDDDCIPTSDLIASYRDELQRSPSAGAVEGAIVPIGIRPSPLAQCPVNVTGGYFWTCNVLVKTHVFRELGGFDEDFPFAAMEDVDFHRRLKSAGVQIPFARRAEVSHPWVIRLAPSYRHHREIASMIFQLKHPDVLGKNPIRGWLSFANNRLRWWVAAVICHPSLAWSCTVSLFHETRGVYRLGGSDRIQRYLRLRPPCCSGCERAYAYLNARVPGAGTWRC